jgi:hypothetical protein
MPVERKIFNIGLNVGVLGLIGLDILLAIAYFVTTTHNGEAYHWLDFDGLRSLPSWLQAFHLGLLSLIAFGLLGFRHKMQPPVSRLLLIALGILFLYAALDEVTKIHLHLDQVNWQAFYLGSAITIPVLCWRDLIMLWQCYRRPLVWVLIGAGIFILGGICTELLKDYMLTLSLTRDSQLTLNLNTLRVTFEELGELIGETLLLYGVGLFVIKSFERDRVPSI